MIKYSMYQSAQKVTGLPANEGYPVIELDRASIQSCENPKSDAKGNKKRKMSHEYLFCCLENMSTSNQFSDGDPQKSKNETLSVCPHYLAKCIPRLSRSLFIR